MTSPGLGVLPRRINELERIVHSPPGRQDTVRIFPGRGPGLRGPIATAIRKQQIEVRPTVAAEFLRETGFAASVSSTSDPTAGA